MRKRYPKCKPSGVEWLGDVPEHWEVKRLKSTATYWVSNVDKVAAYGELPVRLCNYTDVYYQDHITPDMGLMETTATPEEIRRFGLHVGDVVITKDSEEWSDIAVPALVVETAPDLVCGYHLAIVRPNASALNARFLLRALQACAVNQQFQVAATGVTRYGLPKSSIGEAWLLLPPALEQHAIADFLDRETAKIDTLVAKKRTLIERLKEKRTALISRTVTRGLPPDAARAAGLDPHPKLKPSGIDWLGDVPEHWTVTAAWHQFFLGRGRVISHGDISEDPGDYPIYSSQTENEGVMGSISTYDFDGEYITWTTDGANAGTVFARQGRFNCTNVCGTLKAKNPARTNIKFVTYALSLATAEFVRHDINPKLMNNVMKGIRVPFPPVEEQQAIADFLDRETAKIDRMVAKVETAVERLREYRTAVVTAAVTGKIDVREALGRREGSVSRSESARMQA